MWHESPRYAGEKYHTDDDAHESHHHRGDFVPEASVNETVVSILHMFQESLAFFLVLLSFVLACFQRLRDESVLKPRHHENCHQQRDGEHDGHCNWEPDDEVVNHAGRGENEREESDGNTKCGSKDGEEEFACGIHGGFESRRTHCEFFQIAIDDDHSIIDYHTQGNNQSSQRDGIQFHSKRMENGKRGENGDWNGTNGNACYSQREHEHHHNDDGNDGYQQFVEEVIYRLSNHMTLVGDGVDGHIVRQGLFEIC